MKSVAQVKPLAQEVKRKRHWFRRGFGLVEGWEEAERREGMVKMEIAPVPPGKS